jgi:hypothetical protein
MVMNPRSVMAIGSPIAKVLKTAINKVEPGKALTGVLAYDFISDLFSAGGEFETTDQQTADGLIKSTMAIVQDAEGGGIPLNGLKGRDGQPLKTNYIVIDLEKERVFPIFKYRSSKSMRAARRRGSFRGYGRARRSYSQNKYIYS